MSRMPPSGCGPRRRDRSCSVKRETATSAAVLPMPDVRTWSTRLRSSLVQAPQKQPALQAFHAWQCHKSNGEDHASPSCRCPPHALLAIRYFHVSSDNTDDASRRPPSKGAGFWPRTRGSWPKLSAYSSSAAGPSAGRPSAAPTSRAALPPRRRRRRPAPSAAGLPEGVAACHSQFGTAVPGLPRRH